MWLLASGDNFSEYCHGEQFSTVFDIFGLNMQELLEPHEFFAKLLFELGFPFVGVRRVSDESQKALKLLGS